MHSFLGSSGLNSLLLILIVIICLRKIWSECHGKVTMISKVRKVAKIRNQYNQVPHLSQDTTWESDKNITNESQEVSPFQAGDHKAAMNCYRRQSIDKHKTWITQMIPQKKYPLGTVGKNILLEGLNHFHCTNLAHISDVDQDTFGKENTTYTTAKRSALSHQVTTRLQGTDTTAQHTPTWNITNKNDPQEIRTALERSVKYSLEGLNSLRHLHPWFRCGSRHIDVWFAWKTLTYQCIIS